MPYQNITIETKLAEEKWVQAIEVQPGDRGVVHHVLVATGTSSVPASGHRVEPSAFLQR